MVLLSDHFRQCLLTAGFALGLPEFLGADRVFAGVDVAGTALLYLGGALVALNVMFLGARMLRWRVARRRIPTDAKALAEAIVHIGAACNPAVATSGSSDIPVLKGVPPVYEFGSLSKVFTATLLADLVVAGEVSLDDEVGLFLPELRGKPDITLRRLATHSAGLSRLPRDVRLWMRGAVAHPNPYARMTPESWIAAVPYSRTLRRSRFLYSNLGYQVLGAALERATTSSLQEALHRRVFMPLGMLRTGLALDVTLIGHNTLGARAEPWDGAFAAGGVRGTSSDLARFLNACCRPPDARIGGAIRLTFQKASEGKSPVGLGWMLGSGARTLGWHNGATGGFGAYMIVAPHENRWAFALADRRYSSILGDVSRLLFRAQPPTLR